MTLKSSDYRDPEDVLVDVLGRAAFGEADVALVLVREPAGDQEIIDVVRLDRTCHDLDRYDRSCLLREAVDALPIPPWSPGRSPRYSVMTIVARRGLTVIGPDEAKWMTAWLYANPMASVFTGDLILLTPHGWADFTTGWGWHVPRLRMPDPAQESAIIALSCTSGSSKRSP